MFQVSQTKTGHRSLHRRIPSMENLEIRRVFAAMPIGTGEITPDVAAVQESQSNGLLPAVQKTQDRNADNGFSIDPNGERVVTIDDVLRNERATDLVMRENGHTASAVSDEQHLAETQGDSVLEITPERADAFFAFSPSFTGGVFVANRILISGGGNDLLMDDGIAELDSGVPNGQRVIVGAGVGGGPHLTSSDDDHASFSWGASQEGTF